MVHDKNGKPRGYAFIEYEHKSDMSGKFKFNPLKIENHSKHFTLKNARAAIW